MVYFLAAWIAAYLVGAIPFGYLIARSRGVDIFRAGSGNIGATNVGRVLGKPFGILVFLLDFAKGALPTAAAWWWKPSVSTVAGLHPDYLEVGTGLAAFLGHCFPIYLGFRGGKGVATGAGVVSVLMPGPTGAALGAWIVCILLFRMVSLASVAAALVLAAVQLYLTPDLADPRTGFALAAGAMVVIRHRSNLHRILQGTEPRLGSRRHDPTPKDPASA